MRARPQNLRRRQKPKREPAFFKAGQFISRAAITPRIFEERNSELARIPRRGSRFGDVCA
jgi:hypothetical protein